MATVYEKRKKQIQRYANTLMSVRSALDVGNVEYALGLIERNLYHPHEGSVMKCSICGYVKGHVLHGYGGPSVPRSAEVLKFPTRTI